MKYPSSRMATLVGIAGLNSLGKAIGQRLRSSSLRVLGYDADVQAAATSGLRSVGDLQGLAQECETVLVSHSGDEAAAVIDQLLSSGGATLNTLVLCGALAPDRVKGLSGDASAKGIALVDAPLDGGPRAIEGSAAVVFASGPRDAVDRCAPVFQACGKSAYVGEAGSGQLARLVNDLLRWSSILAIDDAFTLVQACGADPAGIREAVLAASGASRALEALGSPWSDPNADLDTIATLAQQAGASLPFLQRVPGLAASLDIGKLQALFNAGIADLTQHEPGPPSAQAEPPPTQVELEPEEADPFLGQETPTEPREELERPLS